MLLPDFLVRPAHHDPRGVAGYKQKAARSMPSGLPLKRPLSPGVAILNKAACGVRSHLNVPAKSLRVCSRSLYVDQANIAEPLSVNFT